MNSLFILLILNMRSDMAAFVQGQKTSYLSTDMIFLIWGNEEK